MSVMVLKASLPSFRYQPLCFPPAITGMSTVCNFGQFCHVSQNKWHHELMALACCVMGSQHEFWGADYSILAKYITTVFKKCYEQKQISSFTSNEHFEKKGIAMCVAPSNLLHFDLQAIHMVFIASPCENPPLWQFYGFHRDGDVRAWGFSEMPERPFFVTSNLFVYTPPASAIHVQPKTLCKQYFTLLQNVTSSDTIEQMSELLQVALRCAEKFWSVEWRTAVPQIDYVDDDTMRFGYLLPLYITSTQKADLALLVTNNSDVCTAVGILDMKTAYTNARLLGKVESEWLRCGVLYAQYHTCPCSNVPITETSDKADSTTSSDATVDVRFLKVNYHGCLYCVNVKHVQQTDGSIRLIKTLHKVRRHGKENDDTLVGILCDGRLCNKGSKCDKIHVTHEGFLSKWRWQKQKPRHTWWRKDE